MLSSETPSLKPEGLWQDVQPEGSRRLLFAALELFAARGYEATTTREITARANISPGALYTHYASKLELLYEISRTGHILVLGEVEQALEDATDATDSVRRFVSAFTRWHARHHTFARVIQYELHALDQAHFDEVRKLRRRFEKLIRSLILRGIANEEFSVNDVDIAVTAILSLGIDVARWYTPRSVDGDELGVAYAEIALRILGAKRPA